MQVEVLLKTSRRSWYSVGILDMSITSGDWDGTEDCTADGGCRPVDVRVMLLSQGMPKTTEVRGGVMTNSSMY